ncbi:MAG: cytochrome c biogenesis protein CcsA [Bacteroidia bacterium]|nr:cytochrome c biogenesis protein CcsA [Bacteroidia bacterium]
MSFISNIKNLSKPTEKTIFGLAWWKWLSIVLLFYSVAAGFLGRVPALPILHETIRNLYFHVTMWFSMMILLTSGLVFSIMYLSGSNPRHDIYASESVNVGLLFGTLGLITGSIWAKFTWGAYWVNDAKLNGAAIGMLVYLAYVVLRNSMDEEQKRARIAAVYNILAYTMFMVFIMIMPRLVDSLHPGNGGNPGFGKYDLDSQMRLVFYPAVVGFALLGVWILQILVRIRIYKQKQLIKNFK